MIDTYLPPAQQPTHIHIQPCFPDHEGYLPSASPASCGTSTLGRQAEEMPTWQVCLALYPWEHQIVISKCYLHSKAVLWYKHQDRRGKSPLQRHAQAEPHESAALQAKSARISVISWGSTSGAVLEALHMLNHTILTTSLRQRYYHHLFFKQLLKFIMQDIKQPRW